MRFIYMFLVALMAFTACVTDNEPVEIEDKELVVDLSGVQNFAVDNAEKMKAATEVFAGQGAEYFSLIEASDFDYQEAWDVSEAQLLVLIEEMKGSWLEASKYYELDEGIVAGVPSLADFDVWLDAGPTGEEDPVEARDWVLTLDDGRELVRPGNFFHNLLEPALWATKEEFVVLESLPDAYLVLAATAGLDEATGEMKEAIVDWEPNLEDVFTALVTMIPTMNEYFGQWEASYFIAGGDSEEEAFIAVSRLNDIQGILTGLNVAYEEVDLLVVEEDQVLSNQIKTGFDQLINYVDDLAEAEQGGKVFTAQEAQKFGAEAQAMADTLTGQVAEAGVLLGLAL